MPLRIVQSNQNARLKDLRRALAKPGRAGASDSLIAVEGPILIAEAIRAGLRIHCVFAAQDSPDLVDDLRLSSETEILLFPRSILSAALTTENPQPVAALVETPSFTWRDALATPRQLVLILAGVQDPGNLGTILRSAEAFGATAVVSLPGTVSPWNPKALRASAGSAFRIPLLHSSADECFGHLREAGIAILAATARHAESANDADLTRPSALIIGNEGNGLAPEIEREADAAVTVPCPGPVESLNAAVAASVLLYEAARQRAALPARKKSKP